MSEIHNSIANALELRLYCINPSICQYAHPFTYHTFNDKGRGATRSWTHDDVIKFSASLALCAGNSTVTGEFPALGPVTRSFDVFFNLHLNFRPLIGVVLLTVGYFNYPQFSGLWIISDSVFFTKNCWVNNREAGDAIALIMSVTVMIFFSTTASFYYYSTRLQLSNNPWMSNKSADLCKFEIMQQTKWCYQILK